MFSRTPGKPVYLIDMCDPWKSSRISNGDSMVTISSLFAYRRCKLPLVWARPQTGMDQDFPCLKSNSKEPSVIDYEKRSTLIIIIAASPIIFDRTESNCSRSLLKLQGGKCWPATRPRTRCPDLDLKINWVTRGLYHWPTSFLAKITYRLISGSSSKHITFTTPGAIPDDTGVRLVHRNWDIPCHDVIVCQVSSHGCN